jgi:hypothetical protein
MNLEKVVFGFFVLLAATLNFGFFIGDIDDPALHNVYELFGAVVVSLIATVLKFGDRTQLGAVHLATSLVADLQLLAAALVWGYAEYVSSQGVTPESMARVAARAAAGPRVPAGGGPAAVPAEGVPAARAVPPDCGIQPHRGAARPRLRRAGAAHRRHRPLGRPDG